MESVAIFVDVQNIYYTVRQKFGCHFNYQAFWDQITDNREVTCAFAYAIDRRDPKQMAFQDILRSIGFEVKLKPYIQRKDGSAKGDWDVGITLDMIEFGSQADVAVLASGDGDFDLVVQKLQEAHQSEVDVFGVKDLTAVSLINAASNYVPIDRPLLLNH